MSIRSAIVRGACCVLCLSPAVQAQAQEPSPTDARGTGAILPDASFEAMFRKYAPTANDFSPLYSWDAHVALDLTVLRRGAGAMHFRSTFQTAGTENIRSRVSVGGTGYLLSLGYVHAYSPDLRLSAGLTHFSSHLTRDLDEKLEEIRRAGATVPPVTDPSEYNVPFFAASRKLPEWRFTPEFEVIVEPVNFRFNGADAGGVRPIYLGSRATLWRGNGKSVVVRTQHEIGRNPFNYFSLSFELDGTSRPEGRLQMFVGASPGHDLHVSPNIGALRDGIALGIRMAFGG